MFGDGPVTAARPRTSWRRMRSSPMPSSSPRQSRRIRRTGDTRDRAFRAAPCGASMSIVERLTSKGDWLFSSIRAGRHRSRQNSWHREPPAGVAALLVGTSYADEANVGAVARAIKRGAPGVPLLEFPGAASHLVPMSMRAPAVARVGAQRAVLDRGARPSRSVFERHPDVEPISTAYLLIDGGEVTSVEAVSQTVRCRQEAGAVAAHVRAAMLVGMVAAYLDAGSGARRPVSPVLVRARAPRREARSSSEVGCGRRMPSAPHGMPAPTSWSSAPCSNARGRLPFVTLRLLRARDRHPHPSPARCRRWVTERRRFASDSPAIPRGRCGSGRVHAASRGEPRGASASR